MELLMELLKVGGNFIFCDFDKTFVDNIAIQPIPGLDPKELDIPDDELRFNIRRLYQAQLGFNSEIYEIRRMTVGGRKCIFIDLSHDPKIMRTHNYLFLLPGRCFTIALTAKKKTFAERREQFSQIIRTIKFIKK